MVLLQIFLIPGIVFNVDVPRQSTSQADYVPNEIAQTKDQVETVGMDEGTTRSDPRNDFSQWGISDFSPIALDNPNKKTIYPGYKPYIFRFNIDDATKFQYITSVNLTITNEDIFYVWHRPGRANDNNVNKDARSSSTNYTAGYYKYGTDLYYLDFNITFPWSSLSSRAKRMIHSWNVEIIENDTISTNSQVDFDYDVIGNLKFIGLLKVEGQYQGILKNNAWVRKNERINWTGLKLVYDSSLSLIPPHSQARILLSDNDVDKWYDQALVGEEMRITSYADSETMLANKHKIDIIGPAAAYLDNPKVLTLKIDGDGVFFYNPIPSSNEWLSNTSVKCEIQVTDNITSGVDVGSLEFQFTTNKGNVWNGWYKPDDIEAGIPVKCSKIIEFVEGSKNYIQWRGRDVVHNEFTYSPLYPINIDNTPLIFRNPSPQPGKLQYNTEIRCLVEIFDEVSGVNASSIQYSFKLDGDDDWSRWIDHGRTINNRSIKVNVNLDFNYGEFNYIKWRAKDVAENNYFESIPFQVNVTHRVPVIHLISPRLREIINVSTPTFKWANSYKMVQPVTYTLTYWLESDPDDKVVIITTEPEYTVGKHLEFGGNYFWEVLPETQDEIGSSESGTWNFTMNTLANIQPWFELDADSKSGETIKITPKGTKMVNIVIYNNGNQYDNYLIELIANPVWNTTIVYDKIVKVLANSTKSIFMNISVPSSLGQGIHSLRIKITSTRSAMINKTVTKILYLNIDVEEKSEDFVIPVELIQWASVLIIIIVIILIIIYVMVSRAKYKKFEQDMLHSGTTGPSAGVQSQRGKMKQVREKDVVVEYQPKHRKVVDLTSKGTEEEKVISGHHMNKSK
jgi:hypothetical protein